MLLTRMERSLIHPLQTFYTDWPKLSICCMKRAWIMCFGGMIDMPLQLNLASSGDEVHFLDVTVMFDPSTRALNFKLYDKRRGNPLFETTLNFPPVDSMLSDGCKYTVLRSQMHRFDRNCTYAADFIANTAALAVRMVRNRYNERRVIDEIHKYRSWDLSKGDWRRVEGRVVRSAGPAGTRRFGESLHDSTRRRSALGALDLRT